MGVRRNLRMRRHAKHNCVHPCLIRITLEYHSLNSCNPGTTRARIPALWKLVLGGSKTLFPKVDRGDRYGRCGSLRRVEEVANKRYSIRRALFHQPMPGACDYRLL